MWPEVLPLVPLFPPAARALIAEGQPIAEAAARAGFADQSHLTRWFGRYYGITPGAYRRAAVLPAGS